MVVRGKVFSMILAEPSSVESLGGVISVPQDGAPRCSGRWQRSISTLIASVILFMPLSGFPGLLGAPGFNPERRWPVKVACFSTVFCVSPSACRALTAPSVVGFSCSYRIDVPQPSGWGFFCPAGRGYSKHPRPDKTNISSCSFPTGLAFCSTAEYCSSRPPF